jgi:hypothetical protein
VKRLASVATVAIFVLAAACSKPAGGPLKYTFDTTKLATVPLEAKQPVTEAQQQHDLAQLQRSKTREAFRDSEIEVEVAKYQVDHAVVVSQLAAAKPATVANSETAALARKTAAAKVAFAEARRGWLDKLAEASVYAAYAAQAKLELEKAKVAQAQNLVAAGFDLAAYERQAQDRSTAAQAAQTAADRERASAETRLAAWVEAERAFMQTAGLQGPAESDRATIDWKAMAEGSGAAKLPDATAPTAPTVPVPAPAGDSQPPPP